MFRSKPKKRRAPEPLQAASEPSPFDYPSEDGLTRMPGGRWAIDGWRWLEFRDWWNEYIGGEG